MSKPLRDVAYGNLLQVAESLETGRLVPPFSPFSLSRHLPSDQCNLVSQELNRLHDSGMQIPHLAYVLRAIADERVSNVDGNKQVELVWSGPEIPGAESRDTSVLVRELFSTAERNVLVAGFAVAQGKTVFQGAADRMRALPDMRVRMFLNVPRPYGDSAPEAELLLEFATRFRSKEWPGEKLPELYYDRRALAVAKYERTSLHAKCIVVDEQRAFVTSANFTEAAQVRNIEVGVLVVDAVFAKSLVRQFEALVSSGVLCRLPI